MTGDVTGPARVAVVGGGISGLAAAWFVQQELDDVEIVVLEKNGELGGHLRVSEVAGVPVDEGAESLLARRPEAVDLVRAVGLGADLVEPAPIGAELWSRGSMGPLPAGTVMGVPGDPATLSGVLTASEIAEAVVRDTARGLPIDDDVAIGRLVASRMGAAVADRLVDPLLGGVYAGRAVELSLDATVPALGAALRRHASLAAAVEAVQAERSADDGVVFAGVDGGVGRLPGAVAGATGATVRVDTTVRELRRRPSGWQLVTGPAPAPAAMEADAVIVALPAAPAARLLHEAAPTAAAELAAVEAASMAIVTLALPASAFPVPPDRSGFLVPPVDGRVMKAVTYSSAKWPWLARRADDLVVLRASVGRHGSVADLQRDDSELVATVLAELHDATGLSGAPVDARVTRWGGALPQYAPGHVDRMARVRGAVAGEPGLAVCGATYDGVGVAACVASARDAAARVTAHLSDARVRIET